jgi:sec-independent protein translocase protein TatA
MAPSFPTIQAGLGGLGPWEMAIVLVIILIVFGAGKLPTIGGSIGQAIRNFKKSMKDKNGDEERTEKDHK